jgi:hypothetical protein
MSVAERLEVAHADPRQLSLFGCVLPTPLDNPDSEPPPDVGDTAFNYSVPDEPGGDPDGDVVVKGVAR